VTESVEALLEFSLLKNIGCSGGDRVSERNRDCARARRLYSTISQSQATEGIESLFMVEAREGVEALEGVEAAVWAGFGIV
jgi:hypothetical protein